MLLMLPACASLSNQTKTVISMVGAGLVVGTLDANLGEGKGSFNSRSMAVGLGAAAITGVGALYYFNDEGKKIEAERQLQVVQKELGALKGESLDADGSAEITRDSGLRRDLPPEYRNLVRPGGWTLYKTNSWVAQGENTLIHQDRILKIEPPRFQPSQEPITKGE